MTDIYSVYLLYSYKSLYTHLSASWTSKKEFVGFVIIFKNLFQLFHIEIMVIISWNSICANHLVQVGNLKIAKTIFVFNSLVRVSYYK